MAYWEYAEYTSASLVAVACFGEYISEFTKWWEGDGIWERLGPIEDRKDKLGKLATLLLIAALVAETVCLFRTNQISGEVLGSLNDLSAAAFQKAKKANDDAGYALTRSSEAVTKAGLADGTSGRSLTKSNHAEQTASAAMTLARGARQEADTFEARLGSAEGKADEAESHVAEAVRRAVEATTALDRIMLPRSLTNIPELATALKAFKETEYTFAAVFADDESRETLKQINGMLQLAGWKRIKQTAIRLGIPAFPVFGPKDLVEMGAYTGIRISVDSLETLENLQKLPPERRPPLIELATLLNNDIFSNLQPTENANALHPVEIEPGSSNVIRIKVGKKP